MFLLSNCWCPSRVLEFFICSFSKISTVGAERFREEANAPLRSAEYAVNAGRNLCPVRRVSRSRSPPRPTQERGEQIRNEQAVSQLEVLFIWFMAPAMLRLLTLQYPQSIFQKLHGFIPPEREVTERESTGDDSTLEIKHL